MEGSTLEEFYVSIGVDADQLTDFQKAVLPMVQEIQKNLADLVSSFDDTTKHTSESQKKLGETSSKLQKGLQETAKKTQNIFTGLKTELLAFAGISLSVGGAVGFVTSMTTGIMQLSIQSKALGMSAKELDGWQRQAQKAGSTAQSITGALSNVQQQMNDAHATGDYSGKIYQVAQRLGVSPQVMVAHDAGDVMRLIMSRLQHVNKADQYTFGGMVGLDAADIQNNAQGKFLPGVSQMTANSNINNEAIERAQKATAAMTDLGQQLRDVENTVFVALEPAFEQVINYMKQWASWLNSHPKEVQAALDKIQKAIVDVVTWANKGADAVGGWKTAIEILVGASVGGKLLSLFTGLSSSIMGPAGLITGLTALEAIVIKPYEDAHPALKNNPVVKTLNNLPGADAVAKTGDEFRAWLFQHTGIQIPTADSGTFTEAGNQVRDFVTGDWAARRAASQELAYVPLQHAQSAHAIGKGKELLSFMSSQFGQLEAQYGLPAGLLNSVATTESNGDQFAQSPAGAKGLFQFMDPTAKDLGLSGNDVFDPQKSAQAAAKYLSELLKHYHGKLQYALAAYNWGEGNVDKYGLSAMPGETSAYVPKVIAGLPQGGAYLAAQRSSVVNNHAGSATTTHISIGHINTSATTGKSLLNDIHRRTAGTIASLGSGQ
ncbi:lytic transglycosylase domain-containing protein [Serratia sp. M24T3]|uniref:lytic transglycosylase domain-containing protein n=1 Tax=Serratia sp. M24T3 TaxID=932213 RepID=UPI00025B8F37|nr:lytic transglycosylase domain-containing protein [Serratia sp. M24T3]EIC83981.1 transglycosylase SLT domain-containing protein [Serratia sp. M24T3]